MNVELTKYKNVSTENHKVCFFDCSWWSLLDLDTEKDITDGEYYYLHLPHFSVAIYSEGVDYG